MSGILQTFFMFGAKTYIDPASHAWGMVLRNKSYAGALVKLRRFNGAVEQTQDFFPDSSGWISESEINTFYAGGTSKINTHTIYDQFGGVNLTTPVDERFTPEVTDASGVIYKINGKPTFRWGQSVLGRTGMLTATNVYTDSNNIYMASKEATIDTFSPFLGFNSAFSFLGATQDAEVGASANNVNASFPYKLFINGVLDLELASTIPSQDTLHTKLVDVGFKIVSENYGTITTGSGFVWGANNPAGQDFGYRGNSSELIIYKGAMSNADIIKNQLILLNSY